MTATARTNDRQTTVKSHESGEHPAITLPTSVIEQLLGYATMKDGWHDKAPAPVMLAVARAFDVLKHWHARLPSENASIEIGPALDGGIDMTFDKADAWVSVLCRNDGRVEIERSDGFEEILSSSIPSDSHIHWLLRTA